MSDRTETIVRELCLFDPTLKEHEASLRVLVADMVERKPTVTIDRDFVVGLRARLMVGKPSIPSPYTRLAWWITHVAPLTAVAVLVLVLIQPPARTHMPSEAPSGVEEATLQMPEATRLTPSLKVESDMGGESTYGTFDTLVDTDDAGHMRSQENAPLTVRPQKAGMVVQVDSVTVIKPSFIALLGQLPDNREGVLGSSPLLSPGTTVNAPLYLYTPTFVGGMYALTLYEDNGNRVYDEKDFPLTDKFGNPISVPLEIVP